MFFSDRDDRNIHLTIFRHGVKRTFFCLFFLWRHFVTILIFDPKKVFVVCNFYKLVHY